MCTGFFCLFLLAMGLAVTNTSVLGQAKKVGALRIVGNKNISSSEIRAWFRLDTLSVENDKGLGDILDRIRKEYARRGYPFLVIDSVSTSLNDTGEPELIIALNEGKRTVLSELQLVGLRSINLKEPLVEEETPFTDETLEQAIDGILKQYEAHGFPFATVRVKDIRFRPREEIILAEATLEIDEGIPLVVKHVKVEGNSVTKSNVITREANISAGVPFRTGMLEQVQRRVERLRLFSKVHRPELFVTDEKEGGILIRIEEGSPNRFDGVVGYVPGARQNESGYVMGLVDVQLRNLFGTGRRLSTRWHREDRLTQEIGLRYFEPWIASYPVNGEIGFAQRKQDSIYVRQSIDLKSDLRISDLFSVGVSFSQTNVYPGEGQTIVRRSGTMSFGGFLSYDSRDDATTPTDGSFYFTEYQTGSKRTSGFRSERTQRITLDLEYYVSLSRRQVIGTMIHGREFRAGSLQTSDLYRLGGTTTLRGYRESQFLGSRLAWLNLEYRYLTGGRSFVYAFLDAAYISSSGLMASLPDQRKWGYGVGIRVETGVGLIGVSLALGEGDTFSTAKLHFRIANEF